jgi:hypothetical protein
MGAPPYYSVVEEAIPTPKYDLAKAAVMILTKEAERDT